MKSYRFLTAFVLLSALPATTFCQLAYFVKLFIHNDRKVIYLFEKEGSNLGREIKIESQRKLDLVIHELAQNKNKLPLDKYLELIDDEAKSGRVTFTDAMHLKSQAREAEIMKIDPRPQEMTKADKRLLDRLLAEGRKEIEKKYPKPPAPPQYVPPMSLKGIQNAHVFISIPSSETEFRALFGEFNMSQLKECMQLKSRLEREGNSHVKFAPAASSLREAVSSPLNKDKPIIVIGHNIDGKIRFPDASEADIGEIDSIAKASSHVVIYLSCKAANYTKNAATRYYLSYRDAVKLTNLVDVKLPVPLKTTSDKVIPKIQRVLDNFGKQQQLRFKIKITTYSVGAAGAGYGIYKIEEK